MWTLKDIILGNFDFWLAGMKKLKAIEEYYEIEFKLEVVEGRENLNQLCDAIDIVYDGINLNENATFAMTGDMFDEKVIIESPTLLEEDKDLPLAERVIHGFVLKPRRSAFLPCIIDFTGKTKDDFLRFPICVGYDVLKLKGGKLQA